MEEVIIPAFIRWPLLLLSAFIFIGLTAIYSVVQQENARAIKEQLRSQTELEDSVIQWRLSIIDEFERLSENITPATVQEFRRTSPQWIDDIYLIEDGSIVFPPERIEDEHPCLQDDPLFQSCSDASDSVQLQSLVRRIQSFVELNRLDKAKQALGEIREELSVFKEESAYSSHYWTQAGRLLYVQILPEITSDHQFLSNFMSELESMTVRARSLIIQHNQAVSSLNVFPIQSQRDICFGVKRIVDTGMSPQLNLGTTSDQKRRPTRKAYASCLQAHRDVLLHLG